MDGTLPHMPKTYDEALTMLRTLPIPFGNGYGHHLREVIDSSTMRRPDGKIDVKLSADDACAPTGRLIFRTSISPYLYDDKPDVMTNARSEMEFARELLDAFPRVGGIYYDAGAGGGGVTYHAEHLRYAHSPLVPGPGTSRMAGKYEFGRWMGEFLHQHGKIHFVNGGAGMGPAQTWHILPFDCIGVEWPPVQGGERRLRFLRALAGRKPLSFLKIQLAGDVASSYATYVGKLGLYGIFPPPGIMQVGTRTQAFSATELAAPYAKLVQNMYLAGWQPVTNARTDQPGVLVERYGPAQGKTYFALFNPMLSDAKTLLTIDAAAMKLGRLAAAAAYFSPEKRPPLTAAGEGSYQISLLVPSRRLVVVQVSETTVDDPAAITDYYPSRHRAWLEEAKRPRLLGQWSFDDGKGQIATDTSGGNADGFLGNSPDADDADPQWAPGHPGGALRFDGENDIVTIRGAGSFMIRDAFTIEASIKRERPTTHARVVELGNACLYFEGDKDRVGLRIGGYSINTAWSTPIPLERWARITASYDGKTIHIAVDGKPCQSKEIDRDTPVRIGAMTIGNAARMSRPFAGMIDEVRVWNYVK